MDSAPLAGGGYIYKATVAGDGNYLGATSADEPLTARTFGKTMGYWHNQNGQAVLAANNAFSAANAVKLGEPDVSATNQRCNVTVDSAAKSLTILPTPNGASLIVQCNSNAKLDTGQVNSFNTLLSQTLALSYNNLYKTGFVGQSIGGMGCTAFAPLTSASTTLQVQAYANLLIGEVIKTGGTNTSSVITQTQIGAMNTLLGCMNAEA